MAAYCSLRNEITTSISLPAPELQALAENLAAQLREDESALADGGSLSPLAVYMPRKGASIDKQNRLAHLVAHVLWAPQNETEATWSLIKYGQLISRLSGTVKEGWRRAESERLALKRAHMDSGAFCVLKQRGISQHVLRPKAMPVALTDAAEFAPFFEFLRSNEVHWDGSAFETCVEFPRGILYSDGRMDLCKQVVGPGSIRELMGTLRHNSHVRHFLLGNNVIGHVGAQAVSDFIARDSSIVTWYLAGNCIEGKAVGRIAAALAANEVVEALWLKRNPVGLVGAQHLSEMLRTNVRLHTLDLDNCGLLDAGLTALLDGLQVNDSLRHLYLSANGITPAGAAALGAYFANCSKHGLESLYLSVNRLGDSGATKLADGLRFNKGLKRLILSSNKIEAQGAVDLCEALSEHPTLEVLDLGVYTSTADMGELPNRLEDRGAQAVAQLIKDNPRLLLVSVAHNGLTEAGWEAIVRAALGSPSLVHLDVVERGLRKTPGLQDELLAHLKANILVRYGLTRREFLNTKLRFVRQPENVRHIDSVYRTRDLRDRAKRKTLKKFWDADDKTLQAVAESVWDSELNM